MATSRAISEAERYWLRVLSTLNELQGRLFVAQKSIELERGGIGRLARLTGMSPTTIARGVRELRSGQAVAEARVGRSRRPGGGRPRAEVVDPGLLRELQRILEETTAGDPMDRLKWTSTSTRALADELTRRGHPVTWPTVARCLHDLDYSLQGNRKMLEGDQHPDRDAQFRYINARVKAFLRSGDPVISVDTKKKELIGRFRNAGRTWRRRGRPEPVLTHDFPQLGRGKAVPYGPYDVGHDEAVVNVGVSHDTAEFAVQSIRRWWPSAGATDAPLRPPAVDFGRCWRE